MQKKKGKETGGRGQVGRDLPRNFLEVSEAVKTVLSL